ncbi:MAG: ferritin, partial [Pseudomonadota bacterium]
GPGLKGLMDKVLTDARWDLKFIGMQVIIEGLALAAFNTAMQTSNVPVHQQGLYYVLRDEARHVKFGMQYLEDYLKRLSPEELEERAQFAFEASTSMGGSRANGTRMFERYGWDHDEVREHLRNNSPDSLNFRGQLFGRIMPNLKSLGLLTNKTKPQWEALGLLEFQDLPSDSQINWSEMERPLPTYEEIYETNLAA